MKIGKTFTFEAAHRLQNHDSKCKNLHGHSYRVVVSIEGWKLETEGSQTGMLIDFSRLGDWWQPISTVFDHVTLLEDTDPLVDVLSPLTLVRTFPWPPTAEHIAIWMVDNLGAWLLLLPSLLVPHVRVYETATSWAEA